MTQLRPKPTRQKFLTRNSAIPKPASNAEFKEDKKLKKRADDLAWQMNFAKMKLNHWHDLDNLDWESLETLLKSAKANYQNLG